MTAQQKTDYVAILPLCSHCDCFLLQHRDDIAGIQDPGMNGTFGGAVESEEGHLAAAARELREETDISFDVKDLEEGLEYRLKNSMSAMGESELTTVFLLRVDDCNVEVYEGQGLTRLPAKGADLREYNLTPFAYCVLNDATLWRGNMYTNDSKVAK